MDRGVVSDFLKNEYSMFYKLSGCLQPEYSNYVPDFRKYPGIMSATNCKNIYISNTKRYKNLPEKLSHLYWDYSGFVSGLYRLYTGINRRFLED